MGFKSLRVINQDVVGPGGGFGTHSHHDMEIISYVLSGTLAHRDSMGNGGLIKPGDVQRMTAGTGIAHSEYNPSDDEPVHFFQIWLLPSQDKLAPEYEQKHFSATDRVGKLLEIAAPDPVSGGLKLNARARIFTARLKTGQELAFELQKGRACYIQMASGLINLNNTTLTSGDGIAITLEERIEISAQKESELLLFDLPH